MPSTPSESTGTLQKTNFVDLGLKPWLVDALRAMAIEKPTEIQSACIPNILNGKDVIGSAKTGSGKTATFALPILQKLAQDPYGVFALVLTPTRELAFQIAEQFRVLGNSINLKQTVVVGGLDMIAQALELSKKPHIVVATPGRLVDHINSSFNAIYFNRLKYLVLDEADRLLDPSFASDLSTILEYVPKERQNLLFTATMTSEISSMSFSDKRKPFFYSCAERFDTVGKLDQRYLFIPSQVRDTYLTYLLKHTFDFLPSASPDDDAKNGSSSKSNKNTYSSSEKNNGRMKKGRKDNSISLKPTLNADSKNTETGSVIIFVSRASTCERLRLTLRELGIRCTALHSKMNQIERLNSLAKFKSMVVPILITTDVGSRGLDIPCVKVVLNYSLPSDATDYVHRVGRTARAGRGGLALSIVTERDIDLVLNIENKIKKKLEEFTGVEEKDALSLMNEVGLAHRVATMNMFDSKFGEKDKINKKKKRKLE